MDETPSTLEQASALVAQLRRHERGCERSGKAYLGTTSGLGLHDPVLLVEVSLAGVPTRVVLADLARAHVLEEPQASPLVEWFQLAAGLVHLRTYLDGDAYAYDPTTYTLTPWGFEHTHEQGRCQVSGGTWQPGRFLVHRRSAQAWEGGPRQAGVRRVTTLLEHHELAPDAMRSALDEVLHCPRFGGGDDS